MKNQLQTIITKLKSFLRLIQRYSGFTIFLVFAAIYTVLILRINSLSGASPTQNQINQKLGSVAQLTINQQALDKVQQLQSQNIQVQALFNQARNNPFSE